jgi:hypothetical protein
MNTRWRWSPFLTSPLGANFDLRSEAVPQGWILSPGGWSYPLGVRLSVRPSILLNSWQCSPLGVNKGVNIPSRGHISHLGAKFTPGSSSPLGARGEVKNGPLALLDFYVCHSLRNWQNCQDRPDKMFLLLFLTAREKKSRLFGSFTTSG